MMSLFREVSQFGMFSHILVQKSLYPFRGHSSFTVIHWETIVTKVHSQMLMAMKSGCKIYTQNVT